MKRLTYRNGRGEAECLIDGKLYKGSITERLAAYEDIAMTPEEIGDALDRFESILSYCTNNRMSKTNYTVEAMLAEIEDAFEENCARYCDLRQAKAEGRLVVLPCKVGDKVFQYDNGGRIYESKVTRLIFVTPSIAFDERAVGKTVFLTREEAETAAKKYEQEHPVCGGCFYWRPPFGIHPAECGISARLGWVFSDDPACKKYDAREAEAALRKEVQDDG
jgi:hypothetical protein